MLACGMIGVNGNPWFESAETKAVMAALNSANAGESRFVGGCVRNTLLGEPIDDIDIATQIHPELVMAAAKAAGLGAEPTGIDHGTVTLIANHIPYEVTTLRQDVTTDGRRATVSFTQNWDDDAQRRDFRVNALYADFEGTIIDPTGGGLDDIVNQRIVFIGDAKERLREDHLRSLRFFRFSARYAKQIDQVGLDACAEMKEGLRGLSAERVWKELKNLLKSKDPAAEIEAMQKIGVFDIIAPELDRLHQMLEFMQQNSVADPILRILAGINPDKLDAFQKRMKTSVDEAKRMKAALNGKIVIREDIAADAIAKAAYAIGKSAFSDKVQLATLTDAKRIELLAAIDNWTRPVFPIKGDDVKNIGVKQGPQIGQILRNLEQRWIDDNFQTSDSQLRIWLNCAGVDVGV